MTFLTKIVSGGQTGVDRAALDVAIELGLDHGGFCPKGRRAEDGRIPDRYKLTETESTGYSERTQANINITEATVVLTVEALSVGLTPGTKLTLRLLEEGPLTYPWTFGLLECDQEQVREFLRQHRPRALNVAGPRESRAGGVYELTKTFLREVLRGC